VKNLKTYEGFFSDIFNKSDDDLAKKVLKSLEDSIESTDDKNSGIIGDIQRYADYKRSVKFKSKEGKIHTISIQKSTHPRRFTTKSFLGLTSGENYILVIDGKHFIDRKSNKSTVSQSVSKKIWNLLDQYSDKKMIDKENLMKSFD
jgi:hypothetical protein